MEILRKSLRGVGLLSWEEGKRIDMSDNVVNLLWGENPIPILDSVKNNIILELDKMNRYPCPMGYLVIDRISKAIGFPAENIVVDNGIDGILNLLSRTIIDPDNVVIITPPTFPVYASTAKLMGGNVREVKLENDFSLNFDKLMDAICENTKAIYIANPNNPTGNLLLTNRQIEEILKRFSGLLVIDECYYGICKSTAVDLVRKYDNLIILRSFSKTLNLAGLRIGYAVGSEYLISAMKGILVNCNPFVLDRLAQAGSVAIEYSDQLGDEFVLAREQFKQKLLTIEKIKVIDTETSFLVLDVFDTGGKASEIIVGMKELGVLIKDSRVYGMDDRYIRIGIPRKDLEDVVIEKLQLVMNDLYSRKCKVIL